MSFNNIFTAVTGATFTAAQYNTYDRDNRTAVWVGTAAGDMDYYTGAAAKARLAKPSVLSFLMNDSGGVPFYQAAAGLVHKIGTVVFYPNGQSSTDGTISTAVTGASLNLVTTKTSTFIMFARASIATGTSPFAAVVRGKINGVFDTDANNYSGHSITTYATTFYVFVKTGVPPGTIPCLLYFGSNGSTAFFNSGSLLVAAITE